MDVKYLKSEYCIESRTYVNRDFPGKTGFNQKRGLAEKQDFSSFQSQMNVRRLGNFRFHRVSRFLARVFADTPFSFMKKIGKWFSETRIL